eukprot:TRINITY_DN1518_c0_g1_i1.p1 TRINITY_DN1518_c0_g1~~TRINITY_DN1518_c0_g1_i1.p1  ORF type:complete len:123 (-),score=52.92 TRINITY_DN1518_c0_g1_i1:4-372(-)
MPKKRAASSDSDSDSGPEDRGPAKKNFKQGASGAAKKSSSGGASGGNSTANSLGGEDPSWHLGKNKHVVVRSFKGQTLIDIREYYVDKNSMETKPGKKGISLTCEQYQKLKSIIDEVDHALP